MTPATLQNARQRQQRAEVFDERARGGGEVLGEAMALFGPDYPAASRDRARILDSIGLDETLEELDRRFFDLGATTDADAMVSAYLAGD